VAAEVLLTLSTATPCVSLAVSRGESLLSELLLAPAKTQGNLLFPAIDQVLDAAGMVLSEVDAFAVVQGPGAFTGLRVGVAAIKGLAQAAGKPVVGVSSLQTLALQAGQCDLPVCALLDARKGEVYAGLFRWQAGRPQLLQPEQVAPPEQVLARIKGPVCFVGDGACVYRTLIVRQLADRAHFVSWGFSSLRAASAAVLALDALRNGVESSPLMLEPVYIRLSEAELNQRKAQKTSG